jgi:heme-NO-binding protein
VKGIVFNLLEDVVCAQYGDDTWDRVLQAAGDDGVYTSLGSYPDDKVFALVTAAASALGQSEDHVLRWFGRQSMPLLAERYPMFFAGLTGTRPFLLTLNDIIHPEVRKLYPGAYVPTFEFDSSSPDLLIMGYRSERKLCALAHGFIEGAADFFSEEAAGTQRLCMHRGDPKCLFELRFRPRAA